MSLKKVSRLRRAKKARAKIARLNTIPRLTVGRSNRHIYAQVFTPCGAKVLVSASSLAKDFEAVEGKAADLAKAVGAQVAAKAKAAGITKVAFDRSGFRYHGRVKALADGAREGGLDF